jgi:hypothetical protein
VPIALAQVETGRWLAIAALGCYSMIRAKFICSIFSGTLTQKIIRLSPAPSAELPRSALVDDEQNCRDLVAADVTP